MKAVVVYESVWGNTREIAEAVASGLARHAEVTVVDVADAPSALPDDVNLVVAGGPTHAERLRVWLERLPFPATATTAAVFGTRLGISRPVPSSAGRKLAGLLAGHGYEVISEPHSFFVHGHRGPLEPGERGRAALWGERVALEAQLSRQAV